MSVVEKPQTVWRSPVSTQKFWYFSSFIQTIEIPLVQKVQVVSSGEQVVSQDFWRFWFHISWGIVRHEIECLFWEEMDSFYIIYSFLRSYLDIFSWFRLSSSRIWPACGKQWEASPENNMSWYWWRKGRRIMRLLSDEMRMRGLLQVKGKSRLLFAVPSIYICVCIYAKIMFW